MYTYFEDAAHGWLKVPKKELEDLHIDVFISGCSYVKGDNVYLEEDRDAGIFLRALDIKPDFWTANVKTIHSNRSQIRSYENYKPDMDKLKKRFGIPAESTEIDIHPYKAKITYSELAMHTKQAGKSVRRLWKHPAAEYGYALMHDNSFLHGSLNIHSDGSISLS